MQNLPNPSKSNPTSATSRPQSVSGQLSRRDIADLPRAQKARLVIDLLGLDQRKISKEGGSASKPMDLQLAPETVHEVLVEFAAELQAQTSNRSSEKTKPHPQVETAITLSQPEQNAQKQAGHLRKTQHFSALRPTPERLEAEHPGVAALVLSCLPTELASELLRGMKPRAAQKTALTLSDLETSGQTYAPGVLRIVRTAFGLS